MTIIRKTLEEMRRARSKTCWRKIDNRLKNNIEVYDEDNPDLTDLLASGLARPVKVKFGRPKKAVCKQKVNIRFDADVLSELKKTGKNWTTRVNNITKDWLISNGRLKVA
ncbi:MAG: BrnA antitoxin family protein [Candidatus Margulisbacteria bacterium]|jgi:uncharacterized protein (DUF4415 family)|nr:BrnA antitoxin family protein [Candidatus Margulisiibacteriota bacterium]